MSQVGGEPAVLAFLCPFGRSPAVAIYRFDQAIARTGIRYRAELQGTRRSPMFILHVPADRADEVRAILAQV